MMTRTYIGHARRPIEEYELSELLSVSPPRMQLYYLLAADSGLRRAEIHAARVQDAHAGRLFIPQGKGAVARWTILTARTATLLANVGAACSAGCPDAAAVSARGRLPMRTDARHPAAGSDRICHLTYGSLGERFKYDRARAGLPRDLCLHSLRHRFATQLLRRGLTIFDIQLLLGHRSITTTAVYLHADPQRFALARKAMECGALQELLDFRAPPYPKEASPSPTDPKPTSSSSSSDARTSAASSS